MFSFEKIEHEGLRMSNPSVFNIKRVHTHNRNGFAIVITGRQKQGVYLDEYTFERHEGTVRTLRFFLMCVNQHRKLIFLRDKVNVPV